MSTTANAKGRNKIAARTVWQLDVKGQRFRCLTRSSGAEASLFRLETRTSKGWENVEVTGGSNDAHELLRRVCCISTVIEVLVDTKDDAAAVAS